MQADSADERCFRQASSHYRLPGIGHSPPDRRNGASREQLLDRVRAEFCELSGLKLTLAQARRLFGLREDICLRVLTTLIRDGLLHLTKDNLYARHRSDL